MPPSLTTVGSVALPAARRAAPALLDHADPRCHLPVDCTLGIKSITFHSIRYANSISGGLSLGF